MQTLMAANRMFILLATMITQPSNCLIASMDDLSDLWHHRYGHVNNKSLKTLESKQIVKGLPQFKATNTACTVCHRGKQHRAVIPKKSQWRASRRLQLVHADLCGPITPTSNSLKRYLLCFIDDFSRKAWIYFLAEKSETFAMFKVFKSFVEKESECDICCLRTDRGGEFTSKEFNVFCVNHGIKRQLTAAYTPQQNGVAERKNRTILNMV
jgi:transposase InsO family protein